MIADGLEIKFLEQHQRAHVNNKTEKQEADSTEGFEFFEASKSVPVTYLLQKGHTS